MKKIFRSNRMIQKNNYIFKSRVKSYDYLSRSLLFSLLLILLGIVFLYILNTLDLDNINDLTSNIYDQTLFIIQSSFDIFLDIFYLLCLLILLLLSLLLLVSGLIRFLRVIIVLINTKRR